MENYSKGANLEKPLELCDVPINNIPVGIVWMKVKPASKMINLIEFAVKSLEENGIQLWSGIGPAVGKTVSCVEIIKRRFGNLHQISKINYQKCEELWEPKVDGLDTLKVVRNVPVIHILLSVNPLDMAELGYQAPGTCSTLPKDCEQKTEPSKNPRKSGKPYQRTQKNSIKTKKS